MTRALRELRVAAVVDEFTEACLAPEVQLTNLDARTWRFQLAVSRPDVLFVESAWRGRRDSWQNRIARYAGPADDTLRKLVTHCRNKGIPTVFWNKEDPVCFDRFVDRAALFDYIFTTDANTIPDYEKRCAKPPGRVHALMFAAQPALHYPADDPRDNAVCFAGSYGEPELADRRASLDILLDAARAFDLRIYDRNSGSTTGHKAFPERFDSYLHDRVDYRTLADIYRHSKVFLNVNSVADSPTMFARRVFELIACGTAVVSTPSAGMQSLFGDVVAVATTVDQARAAIHGFLEDDDYRREATEIGIQHIIEAHTYEHRLREVCAAIGIELGSP